MIACNQILSESVKDKTLYRFKAEIEFSVYNDTQPKSNDLKQGLIRAGQFNTAMYFFVMRHTANSFLCQLSFGYRKIRIACTACGAIPCRDVGFRVQFNAFSESTHQVWIANEGATE